MTIWYNYPIENDVPALCDQPGTRVPTMEVATMNNDTFTPSNGQASAYVYLIQAESGPVKIGIANDPSQRLATLQTANYELLSLMYRIECNSPEQALMVERALHSKYADQRIRGEWFDVEPQDIVNDFEFAIALSQSFRSIYVEYAEIQVPRNNYSRVTEARDKVRQYLAENAGADSMAVRELADIIGVGKTTVAEVLKEYKEAN